MWEKPSQLTAVGTARPIRVAYLLDVADAPAEVFESIVAEGYSRWGGRRTLLVPATADGIDTRYAEWLWAYDADIIYSFVQLNDLAVAAVHERYGPGHLTAHRDRDLPGQQRSFRIELPLECLPSLSVLPAFANHRWGFEGPPRNIRIISKYFDRSESAFLQENFGFVRTSFPMGGAGMPLPDLYSPLSLITAKGSADGHSAKEEGAEYLTDEGAILDRLAERKPGATILSLANMSAFFSPYLETGEYGWSDGVTIVIGDSVDDRLMSWNGFHRVGAGDFGEVSILRLAEAQASDEALLRRIGAMVERRGKRSAQGQSGVVTLRSCSLPQQRLDEVAAQLRRVGRLSVRAIQHDGHWDAVPAIADRERVSYRWGTFQSNLETRETTEFAGRRLIVPRATPWHMREALPPAGLRHGSWMEDLTLDRDVDHCAYVNQRHIWVLPRRLRLEKSFTLEGGAAGPHDRDQRVMRVTRTGMLAVELRHGQDGMALTIPEDTEAFFQALSPLYEWAPFDRNREQAPTGRLRLRFSRPSDKGRYLLGVLGRFATLPDAFYSLMHGFWHDVLAGLGGTPVERNELLREELITVLRRRLGQRHGNLNFGNAEELDTLGREALRIARKLSRQARYLKYEELKTKWDAEVVEPFLSQHPARGGDDDDSRYRDEARLEELVQHLCQCEVLYQGREWQCQRCYNRNWVAISEMKRTLECAVCGNTEAAPVSAGWHFRGNPFVIDAYREHGIEAVIWTLWQLWERARDSFYFTPSLSLWVDEYPEDRQAVSDLEIDALAVVDGKLYLCEAKSSAGLKARDIEQLIRAAERIRPDVIIVACMEQATDGLRQAVETLRAQVGEGIEVELLDYRPEMLERVPYQRT